MTSLSLIPKISFHILLDLLFFQTLLYWRDGQAPVSFNIKSFVTFLSNRLIGFTVTGKTHQERRTVKPSLSL